MFCSPVEEICPQQIILTSHSKSRIRQRGINSEISFQQIKEKLANIINKVPSYFMYENEEKVNVDGWIYVVKEEVNNGNAQYVVKTVIPKIRRKRIK